MFKTSRAILALVLSGLLLGSSALPALADGPSLGEPPAPTPPSYVSVPYGSGPIVIDPLANIVTPPGADILPGNDVNGVFGLNNAVTAYGWGEADGSAIAPAYVKNLEQPGDFVGQIDLIDAGADIFTLHQKNRLRVIILPYAGFSGNLKLSFSGKIVQSDGKIWYSFNGIPINVTVEAPAIKAMNDSATGPGTLGGIDTSGYDKSFSAEGRDLTIPDILANDAATFDGRSQTVFFGSQDNPEQIVNIPEGVVNMVGSEATFYSYDPKFTGKTTPLLYTVCSSYSINPRGFLDLATEIDNSSTSSVCSTATLTFNISPAPAKPVVPVPAKPVVPVPVKPVVPVPAKPVVPVPAKAVPVPVKPAPVASSAHAPFANHGATARGRLHIADGSAAGPVLSASPAVPVPVAFGVAALVMVIFAGGIIAVGRMRRN